MVKKVSRKRITNLLKSLKIEKKFANIYMEKELGGMEMVKKVAILTNGGDAPGLNAVIRAIVKTAETNGVECYGVIEGYKGLLNNDFVKLDSKTNRR